MLKRETFLKNITRGLGLLKYTTEYNAELDLYDQNIIAEYFVVKLLNIIYGYNLINLNSKDKSCAAIDLGDYERKLCFQVTSTSLKNHRTKIQETINLFIGKKKYQHFDHLKFLFLGDKQKTYQKGFDTQNLFTFDPKKDVINLKDLIRESKSLSDEKLEKLNHLIESEIFYDNLSLEMQILQQRDIEALKIYRDAFDRPALQDSFHTESSYQDFEAALTDLISLLKTGLINGKLLAKPIPKFDDKNLEHDLNNLYKKVRILRESYNKYKTMGEIIPDQNITRFKLPNTPVLFNTFKQDVIDTINSILEQHNIRPIDGVS
ncbi:SMEK domain-containing protein [Anabaena sp. UHCC 0187]|uniref:SMEK domain-containing protein n=1 Tax=Anabaena sp. UHCC 0187 TaxID=2590018 RepID=UPI0014455ED0|nr:SMEK domain-containing protein [Anabaena sp. UHCC 0187]MTJ11242.1 SMEK domain-containing protein [Anabaena sp. UHCC 0187]